MKQRSPIRPFLLATCFAVGLLLFSLAPPVCAKADGADKIRYAYMPADTVLYRADEEGYAPLVVLPATYFVALLGENEGDYLFVSYLDLTGFVASSAVEICDYTPVYTYAKRTATPSNDGLPVNLRKTPDHLQGEILLTAPPDAAFTLYGSLSGSAMIPAVGDEWRYVKYSDSERTTFGYVYAGHTFAEPVRPNVIEKMPETPVPPPDTTVENAPAAFDTKLQIIFIVALSVPAVAVMLLLFRKRPEKKSKVPRGTDT